MPLGEKYPYIDPLEPQTKKPHTSHQLGLNLNPDSRDESATLKHSAIWSWFKWIPANLYGEVALCILMWRVMGIRESEAESLQYITWVLLAQTACVWLNARSVHHFVKSSWQKVSYSHFIALLHQRNLTFFHTIIQWNNPFGSNNYCSHISDT